MSQIIECVPNFSEGRDMTVIGEITDAIESVDGIALLDVDPGRATNRTVVTFAGPPLQVVEGAVRAAQKAAELIDMRLHHGEHPRFGAMDVCPLVPVSGISIDETAKYAHQLAKRLGDEVGLTVFCYEQAATIITSNLDFREWSDAFPNRLLGAATLDRLRHNAYRLILEGPSYRTPRPLPEEAHTGGETPGKPPAKGKVVKS